MSGHRELTLDELLTVMTALHLQCYEVRSGMWVRREAFLDALHEPLDVRTVRDAMTALNLSLYDTRDGRWVNAEDLYRALGDRAIAVEGVR